MSQPSTKDSPTPARKSGRPLPRPFLKWAGGKTQLLEQIDERLPRRFSAYFEPFLGGGAVFFHLYRQGLIKEATLSDINAELITTWSIVRDDVAGLIEALEGHKNDEAYFYEVRGQDTSKLSEVERAARIIFLNKTCFNGLYRVNSKGEFNVPFGRYQNPTICDKPNLLGVSEALQGVNLVCQDFEDTLELAGEGDFVYLDPPYQPRSGTSFFTAYTKDGFDEEDQEGVSSGFIDLTKRGAFAMLSNSETDYTAQLYDFQQRGEDDDNVIKVDMVKASRFINSKAQGRGKIKEFLVCNYTPDPRRSGKLKGYRRA